MKDEIKEILDRAKKLKYKCDCCEEILQGKYVMRDDKQTDNLIEVVYIIDKLLDCITNLQEKLNQYENPDDMTLFYMWLDEKAKDKMKQLQEENERLKDIIDDNEENAKYLLRDNKDLQDKLNLEIKRINKALDKLYCYGEVFDRKILQQFQKEMINILKGE